MSYLGIGETPEFLVTMGGMAFDASVRSGWSVSDREAANFYDRDRDLIRDLRYLPHALAMRAAAADAGTQFFMVNAAQDVISPPDAKRRQQAVLARAGFEAHLQIVEAGDIDGELFKTMTHGLDCSLKRLFDRYIGRVRPRAVEPDLVSGATVAYEGVDRVYRFRHGGSDFVAADAFDRFEFDLAETAAAA